MACKYHERNFWGVGVHFLYKNHVQPAQNAYPYNIVIWQDGGNGMCKTDTTENNINISKQLIEHKECDEEELKKQSNMSKTNRIQPFEKIYITQLFLLHFTPFFLWW